jgi:hypothetical protein
VGQEFFSAPSFFSPKIVWSGCVEFLNFRSGAVDLREESIFQKRKICVIFLLQFDKEEFFEFRINNGSVD